MKEWKEEKKEGVKERGTVEGEKAAREGKEKRRQGRRGG